MTPLHRHVWLAPLLALQAGCGLAMANLTHQSPATSGVLAESDQEPPHSRAFAGDVRDHLTFRLEPGATLEFWSDAGDYVPTAVVDGKGAFSVVVDVCREEATLSSQFLQRIMVPGPAARCAHDIGRFQFRARMGQRCSLPEPEPARRDGWDRLMLWLVDCAPFGPGGHDWRPMRLERIGPPAG